LELSPCYLRNVHLSNYFPPSSKKLIFPSWPSNPLSSFFLVPQIQLPLTFVLIYKLYLLTYLLTYVHFCFYMYGCVQFNINNTNKWTNNFDDMPHGSRLQQSR